ncbi:hypothetical protein [Bacillus halotolerans]|uniref:hypothetical protein n=1 Tax=Bacillus halotolerans TaxID=260554 RepID=UPI002DB653CE|nr:hypothetical protein [Bacillus halotolerans]MEC1406954.1 hypothetical protein [Bacillus halotolerans]
MKKLLKCFGLTALTVVLLLSGLFTHERKVAASESSNKTSIQEIDLTQRISSVNGIKQKTEGSKQPISDASNKLTQIAKKEGLEVENSYQTYIAYGKKDGKVSTGQVTSDSQRIGIQKSSKSVVYLSHTFLGGKVNKVIHGVEISKVVGVRPATLEVQQALCKSGYYNKQFTCPHVIRKTFVGGQIKKGAEVHQLLNVNYTSFWKYSGSAIATWAGKPPTLRTLTWTEGLYLTNKKGTFFPVYTDKQSGLDLLAPANVYFKKVKKKVDWGNKERKAYRVWYEKKYGKKTWAKFEIHHQLPREYGGGNSTSNLIPLDTAFHRSEVNPWWRAY